MTDTIRAEAKRIRLISFAIIALLIIASLLIWNQPAFAADSTEISYGSWTPNRGMPTISGFKVSVRNNSHLQLSWNPQKVCDGYQVQTCRNVMYYRASKTYVSGGSKGSVVLTCPDTTKRYFARIRGVRKYKGKTYYTKWVPVNTGSRPSVAGIQTLKRKGQLLDVRKHAGIRLTGYNILQGSCSDGKHVYMAFEKRNGDHTGKKKAMIKIVKIRLSDYKIVGISPRGQMLGHANDITYNPYKGQIVVTGAKVDDPYVRIVSPKTLEKTSTHRIALGGDFSDIEAFNAIDFDPASRTYILRSRNYSGWSFILDQNFRVKNAIRCSPYYSGRHVQGSAYKASYYLVPQSWYQSTNKNTITIYDKKGNRLQNITVRMSGEIESVFFAGGSFYGTSYKWVNNQQRAYIIKILM